MRTLIGAFCATALTAMAFVPTTASATCTQSVYAAVLFNGLSGGVVGGSYYSYFYGEPFGAGSTVTYYGYITNPALAASAATAAAAHTYVEVEGDAASCPTSGTYQYLGNIVYMWLPSP